MADHYKISIICALHDHDCLKEHMIALANQSVSAAEFEVIYADGWHGFDASCIINEVSENLSPKLNVRYLRLAKGGRAFSFNRGIEAAKGSLVLLLADDFIATPQLLENHLEVHQRDEHTNVVSLGPALFSPSLNSNQLMSWLEESGYLFGTQFLDKTSIPRNFFYGVNVMLKKEFIFQAGLFDEDFPHYTFDDFELGLRLFNHGMKVVYLPEALVWHEHAIDLDARRRAMWESGESARIFDQKYDGHQSWHVYCQRPQWRMRLIELVYQSMWFITRRQVDLENYYLRSFARHFVAGYKRTGKGSV